MPKPNKGESEKDFIARYMSDETAKKDFPDAKQRLAVAYSEWKKHKSLDSDSIFQFKATITKIWEEPVEVIKSSGQTEKSNQVFIETTVSGLKEDRDNEMMSQDAVDSMIVQFKSGTIPFFPDHGFHELTGQKNVYSWKQMMGVWVDGRQEGNDLKAVCRLNKAHPDFEMFKSFVQEGMPIGFSVGGKVTGEPYFIELDDEPETTKEIKEVKNEKKN
jgi:hypothetical protein